MPSQTQANIEDLITGAGDYAWSVNLDQELIAFNNAQHWGLDISSGTKAAIDAKREDLLPQENTVDLPTLYRRVLSEGPLRVEYSSHNGRILELSLIPIVVGGKAAGISVYGKDITERKLSEVQLRDDADALKEAEIIGGLGRYVFDIAEGQWTGSDVLDEILGIDKEYPHTLAGWTALIHSDDRAMMAAYLAEDVLGAGQEFNREYRIIRRTDGTERWVHGKGSLKFDAQGRPMKMRGIIRDITARKFSELQLAASEERYRASFEQAALGIIHTALDGKFLACNARFAEIIGYPPDEVVGLDFRQITPSEDLDESELFLQRIWLGAKDMPCLEKRYFRKDGSVTWVKLTGAALHDSAGHVLHTITMVEDINSRKAAETQLAASQLALQASEWRYRAVFQTSPDLVTLSRLSDGMYIDANQGFLDCTGYESHEVIGRTSLEIGIWADPCERQRYVSNFSQGAGCRHFEARFRRKSGETFSALISATAIEIDGIPCVIAITRDVTDAREAAETIRDLAFFDPLTHLPNRRLLLDRLCQTPADRIRRHKRALLFVDLDNFKTLNDTLGHQTGDLMLRQVADRLIACVREADTVARLGGDEFVVMLEYLSNASEEAAAQAETVGEKIMAAISRPFMLAGREFHKTCSIGIAIFGAHMESTNDVLQQSEIAMFQAKTAGRNTMRFFAPGLQATVNARAALEQDLREAIRTNQFLLYYQPQFNGLQMIGAEALLRWNHPERGILAPSAFIDLAEETGLILPLGDWALENACKQVAAWSGSGAMAHVPVAVNISARQFLQPNFVNLVLAAIDRTGANPRAIKLELTETTLVENFEAVITKMNDLRLHGLRFSMDDFGTGYSSLAYLKRLPLDELKIDRAFVRDILDDVASGAIAQTIVSLGRAMGLSVVAEGVETEEQRDYLIRIGCHSFQGYFFSRPVPAVELEALLPNLASLP